MISQSMEYSIKEMVDMDMVDISKMLHGCHITMENSSRVITISVSTVATADLADLVLYQELSLSMVSTRVNPYCHSCVLFTDEAEFSRD